MATGAHRVILIAIFTSQVALAGCLGGVFGDEDPRVQTQPLATQTWQFDGSGMIDPAGPALGETASTEFIVLEGTQRLTVNVRLDFRNPTGQPPPVGPEGNATVTVGPDGGTAVTRTEDRDSSFTFSFDQPLPGRWTATVRFIGQGSANVNAYALVQTSSED